MKPQEKEIPIKPYVSIELLTTLTQVLYREARLLDQEQYDDWMNLMAEDLHYHMPGIETRYRRDKYDQVADLNRMAFYDDSKEDLKKRLARLETGTAWSEDPATRYVHLISNVEVELTEKDDEFRVLSNFYAYRNRNERDNDMLIGHRSDIWRSVGERFELVKRQIILKQNILLSKNLNIYL